jgi:hypothetical protein
MPPEHNRLRFPEKKDGVPGGALLDCRKVIIRHLPGGSTLWAAFLR